MNFEIKGYAIHFSSFCYSSVHFRSFVLPEVYFVNHIYLVFIYKMHEYFGEFLIKKLKTTAFLVRSNNRKNILQSFIILAA